MKEVIKIDLPPRKEYHLCAIGDMHIGAKACDKEALVEAIQEIKRSRKSYVVLMGDTLDCITNRDKRYNVYEVDDELPKFKDQVDWALKILKPIKKKIIGILEGNHEYKIKKNLGYDFTEFLAEELETNYLQQAGMLNLKTPWGEVRVFAMHGLGGGVTVGGQINRILKAINNLKDAPDITLVGHFHRLDSVPMPVLDDNLKVHKLLMGFTGSFYRTYLPGIPNYASDNMYPPSLIGYQRYVLSEGHIHALPREFL